MEEVDIPTFAEVREALEKGGCKFNLNLNKKYCRSGKSAVFKTEEAFRRDLCANGVNCRCGSADEEKACECWDENDKWSIKLWVRYAVIGGTPQSDKVHLIDLKQALILLTRLGFIYLKSRMFDGYGFPGVLSTEDGIMDKTMFREEKNMWKYLSRYDLPESCNYEMLSADERLSLEYLLSTNTKIRPDTL